MVIFCQLSSGRPFRSAINLNRLIEEMDCQSLVHVHVNYTIPCQSRKIRLLRYPNIKHPNNNYDDEIEEEEEMVVVAETKEEGVLRFW